MAEITTSVTPAALPPASPQETGISLSKPVLFALVSLFVLFLGFAGWYIFGYTKSSTNQATEVKPTAAISGTVTVEGYYSPDSYIAIAVRKAGKAGFQDVISGITPSSSSASWNWKDADRSGNYEVKATLKVKGKEIDESPITVISSPAQGVVLHIVSDQQPPVPQQAEIGGTVHVEGYIPPQSTISILAKASHAATYTTIASNISPTDGVSWSWTSASSGQTYILKARLLSSGGQILTTSDPDTATAPSSEELLQITSPVTPPAPVVTGLSGTIVINGNIPPSSYITLATRVSGTSAFNQVVGNIAATNGVAWDWGSASSGGNYDVQAYLWANGKPYAQSNIVTIAAPSVNNTLTINAQSQTSAPSSNSINVTCNTVQNSQYQASINFNTTSAFSNAQQYNVIVTQASTGSQVVNTTITPNNPGSPQAITTNFIFTQNTTYYAQYAYATTTNGNFSPLSPSYQFSCQ